MSNLQTVVFAPIVLTMDPAIGEGPLGCLRDQVLGFDEHGKLLVMGTERLSAPVMLDATGQIVMPHLVDMHTHSVWAGDRAHEWQRRLAGCDYSEILEQGGGILSTVRETRKASDAHLVQACAARLAGMRALGTTTVEVKTGYALRPADELRCLAAMEAAGRQANVNVVRTFLGAHTFPPEFRDDKEAYCDLLIDEMLPSVVGTADFVDVYCDRGAFDLAQTERILTAAKSLGLRFRVHAEQCTFTGVAGLASRLGAHSVDHLEHLDDAGIEAMARAGTIAGLLPGAQLYLGDPSPPTSKMREAGVRFAVATDCNPGTSPVNSLWTAATLACVQQGLTVSEALLGITSVAAQSLGLEVGRVAKGQGALIVRPGLGAEPTPGGLLQALNGPAEIQTLG